MNPVLAVVRRVGRVVVVHLVAAQVAGNCEERLSMVEMEPQGRALTPLQLVDVL